MPREALGTSSAASPMSRQSFDGLHPLQRIVAAALARDEGPSGFQARLALGVRGERGARYLVMELGPSKRLGISELHPNVDTVVELDEAVADGILERGSIPGPYAPGFRVYGDGRIFQRLVARYLSRRSFVAVRAGKMD